MELRALQSSTVSTIPIPRSGLIDKPFLHGNVIKLPNSKKSTNSTKLQLFNVKVQASGTKSSLAPVEAIANNVGLKDDNLIYVAGATGKVGSRTVRELLKLGFRVRAGVRSAQRAESLVKSVQQMKLGEAALEETQPIQKLEIVECDLEKRDQIGQALGNASIIVCCIGASEKEVFDITGPYRIDYQATKNLVDAATVAKVNHFILLTSLGTNKVGFPAAILNLFWGVLIWKRKAEEALLVSGIPYSIVRPGGMERPTDAFKETHNITLSQEDTLFGGQVSNLQVAELMAFMVKNRSLSYCKVVEVVAETTAPLTPMGELLAKIPSQRVDNIYPPKEPSAAVGTGPAVSKSITSEPIKTAVVKETTQAKETVTRPLSPYSVYEDLKPPVSPTPKAPGGGKKDDNISETVSEPTAEASEGSEISVTISDAAEPKSATVEATLSPYTAYEDLKPPSSPSPIPSRPREIPSNASACAEVVSQITTGNDVAKIEPPSVVHQDPPQALTSSHSPYHAYEDLKPPTTPTPSPRKY